MLPCEGALWHLPCETAHESSVSARWLLLMRPEAGSRPAVDLHRGSTRHSQPAEQWPWHMNPDACRGWRRREAPDCHSSCPTPTKSRAMQVMAPNMEQVRVGSDWGVADIKHVPQAWFSDVTDFFCAPRISHPCTLPYSR